MNRIRAIMSINRHNVIFQHEPQATCNKANSDDNILLKQNKNTKGTYNEHGSLIPRDKTTPVGFKYR